MDSQNSSSATAGDGPANIDDPSVPDHGATGDSESAATTRPVPVPTPSDTGVDRTLPWDDGFIPNMSRMSLEDTPAQHYWEEVFSRCTEATRLNSSSVGRGVFAFGNVVVKTDHHAPEVTRDYSAMDETERAAANLIADVIPDVQLPQCYLKTKVDGRDLLVQSRITGSSLQEVWPHLTKEQKIKFKDQARRILERIHHVKTNRSSPSYFAETKDPKSTHHLTQDEYDILFGNDDGANAELAATHNNMSRSNIIVEDDRIVGLVGWSNAGYFNWERTKKVHSTLRCSEKEEAESDVPWYDLYDIAVRPSGDDAHLNSGVNIKTEALNPSLDAVPRASPAEGTGMSGDLPTSKKITDLKHESMSRAPSSERTSPAPSSKGGKKRATPSTTTAKKGASTRKPTSKKRKLNDAPSTDGSPAPGRGSVTPSSAKLGKTSTQRQLKQSSLSVASSPVPDDKVADGEGEEADDDDDVDPSEVFCICRKPDNHTWMIGCDGGCEDWFHGKCINIKQIDADLIDKYICPACEKKFGARTTWKPMCRLPECHQPARVNSRSPSKYCSDDHGRKFMLLKLDGSRTSRSNSRVPDTAAENGINTRSRASSSGFGRGHHKASSHADGGGEDDGSNDGYDEDDEDMDPDDVEEDADNFGSRGGVLTKGDLKAVLSFVTSGEEFRKLGESVLSSQPAEIQARFGNGSGDIDFERDVTNIDLTPEERPQVEKLQDERAKLRNRLDMFSDREKFIGLVRLQAKQILERLRQSEPKGAAAWKDICGFDPRFSWSDEEFDEWRLSESGRRAFEAGNLEPPESVNAEVDAAGDTEMTDGNEAHINRIACGVCIKRRCERHKQWLKVQQQDIRFEQATTRDKLTKCERKAKEVIERVVLRIHGGDNDVTANGVV